MRGLRVFGGGVVGALASVGLVSLLALLALIALLALLAAACGGGEPSLQEYGDEAEVLVREVTVRIDTLDEQLDASSGEGIRTYWTNRLDARAEFLDGLSALEPPEVAEELHESVVDLFRRLNAAEEALAARVATLEPGIAPGLWWETPEGEAARAVDDEVTAICHVAQAEFDETEDRAALEDTPWIPSEMKEVVRVAFRCADQ